MFLALDGSPLFALLGVPVGLGDFEPEGPAASPSADFGAPALCVSMTTPLCLLSKMGSDSEQEQSGEFDTYLDF